MKINRLFLGFLLAFVLVILSACAYGKDNRQWIENKFATELSRVYPTTDLMDLFEEFPDGFRIYQTYMKDDYYIDLTLYGDSDQNTISGTLKVTDLSTPNEDVIFSSPVTYSDNHLIFENEEAKSYWSFNQFLIQDFTINKNFLSGLRVKDKGYNFQNGSFDITYELDNDVIDKYLSLSDGTSYTLELGGSESNRGYYYSVVLRMDDDSTLYTNIYDDKN